MSVLCKCGCGGSCTGGCACTTDDTGAMIGPEFCWHCATTEAVRTWLMPHWFITNLACVTNLVTDEGVPIDASLMFDRERFQATPNISQVNRPVNANNPTDVAAAGPYLWVPDPSLQNTNSRIKNAAPPPSLLGAWGGNPDSITTACVLGANFNHITNPSGDTQRTNGWHIGFGYDTSDSSLYNGTSKVSYPYYPTKPPVVPLVPNVPYVYGALLLDTNVRLSFTDSEEQRVCINAIAWLRGEFCLGRVSGSSPVKFRYAFYRIPIFEHDGRLPKTKFCALQSSCLTPKRRETTPTGLEEYFQAGRACIAGYKWKFQDCQIRLVDFDTREIHVVPGTVTRTPAFWCPIQYTHNITGPNGPAGNFVALSGPAIDAICPEGPGYTASATITQPCRDPVVIDGFGSIVSGPWAPGTTITVTLSGWHRVAFFRMSGTYGGTQYVGKIHFDGTIETLDGTFDPAEWVKVTGFESGVLGKWYMQTADATALTIPGPWPGSFRNIQEQYPASFLDVNGRLFPHIGCVSCSCATYEDFSTGKTLSGTEDHDWQWETTNAGGTYAAAHKVSSAFKDANYVTEAGAEWIGPNAAGTGYDGVRLARRSFNITGIPDRDITIRISGDTRVTAVIFNGEIVPGPYSPDTGEPWESVVEVVLPLDLQVEGANELRLEVTDDSILSSVTGLLVKSVDPEEA